MGLIYCYLRGRSDLQNDIFFTPSKFKAEQFYPKNYIIFGKTKFATNQRNNKIQWNILIFIKIHLRTLIINWKYVKIYVLQNFYHPKCAKLWQQNEFTTKHNIFSYKLYPNPENFTPSRMVWMVTLCKSEEDYIAFIVV